MAKKKKADKPPVNPPDDYFAVRIVPVGAGAKRVFELLSIDVRGAVVYADSTFGAPGITARQSRDKLHMQLLITIPRRDRDGDNPYWLSQCGLTDKRFVDRRIERREEFAAQKSAARSTGPRRVLGKRVRG